MGLIQGKNAVERPKKVSQFDIERKMKEGQKVDVDKLIASNTLLSPQQYVADFNTLLQFVSDSSIVVGDTHLDTGLEFSNISIVTNISLTAEFTSGTLSSWRTGVSIQREGVIIYRVDKYWRGADSQTSTININLNNLVVLPGDKVFIALHRVTSSASVNFFVSLGVVDLV